MYIILCILISEEQNEIFGQMGLDMTTAVNMFLLASIRERGLPFAVNTVSQQDRLIEQFVAARLRLAEQQERSGQFSDFESFAAELKSKYAD